ncbi:MAG: alpha/beta hydrolase domain-containing protein [Acidimicrobiales bacterium]
MTGFRVEVMSRAPYAGGRRFGSAGPYELLDAVLVHGFDPHDPANGAIVDLDRAPTRDDGRVETRHRIQVLRPSRGSGNGATLIDVVNRGRPTATRFLCRDDSDPLLLPPQPPPGDGFLMEQGWTVVFCGWQHDLTAHPGLLGLEAPPALGVPAGEVRYRFQLPAPQTTVPLGLPGLRPQAAVGPGELWESDDEGGSSHRVPPAEWAFAKEGIPNPRFVHRRSGFRAGRRYEVRYQTDGSAVGGVGLLALRDLAAALHNDHDTVLGFGVSQCGRVLRQFLADGLNLTPGGGAAFDGLAVLIAGGRLGAFNVRYGNPGALPAGEEGLDGPVRYDELLEPLRAVDAAPKVLAINTATEYWRGDGALVHLAVDRSRVVDAPPDPDTCIWAIAGTQHTAGVVPQIDVDPYLGDRGRHGFNTVDWRPVARAGLVALHRWAAEGTAPPPDCHPRIDDGTAVERADAVPAGRVAPTPPADGPHAPVCALGPDGNEDAGVRLPDLTVPLGVHTGWNLRHPDTGGGDQPLALRGATTWFPPDDLAARYGNQAEHTTRVRTAAETLASAGYVLPADVEVLVADAEARWADAHRPR